MRTVIEKKAIYGALQRLLDKINMKYPYTCDDFYADEDDGYCPNRFWIILGLNPNIMDFGNDFREFRPELGDTLLQEVLKSGTLGCELEQENKETFFIEELE
ncbi:hypothetical protein KAW18_03675 [candidate division WOR-3 bacterium]|nr:hypothetical protein [Candidatus Parcubacteria bacterium]MCK4526446.1 hypothetical protein [candidate division WOR-3 bacterium]